MKSIHFTKDWNQKLSGPSVFTTIRRKSEYGHLKRGERVNILLNNKQLFPADIVEVFENFNAEHNQYLNLVAMLDTGLTKPNAAFETLESLTAPETQWVIIVLRREQVGLFD